MTRTLLVRCSCRGCTATGEVDLHHPHPTALPPGWYLVSHSYQHEGGLEFCSMGCVVGWAQATAEAHRKQREREARRASMKAQTEVAG